LLIVFKIYEQSRFATETGAAIHIAPNANGLLKKLGVHADQIGANLMERVRHDSVWKSVILTQNS
jgi:hypothetical protein